jgi:hypothetical protein
MLSVTMLSGIILIVIRLSVILLTDMVPPIEIELQ